MENTGFTIRRKDRREGGANQASIAASGTIRVHYPDVHLHGAHEVLFQEFAAWLWPPRFGVASARR